MQGGHDKREHAKMPAVVKQCQEARIEPGERADRENDGEHHECGAAECADSYVDLVRHGLRRLDPDADGCEDPDVEPYRDDQNDVVDELGPVPLDRPEAGAHGLPSASIAGAAGGARSTSDVVSPSPTSTARTGQITRWSERCARVMACCVI